MPMLQRRRFLCCGQGELGRVDEFSGDKTSKSLPFTQEIFVRATGSEGGKTPSPTGTRASSEADSSGTEQDDLTVWFECDDEFDVESEERSAPSGPRMGPQQSDLEQAVAALPAKLAGIVKKYTQGCFMGCKPTVALIKYMEGAGLTMEQLRSQLAPVLAAEQAHEDLPTPTHDMSPAERTLSLSSTAPQSAAACSTACQQGTPSIARLLDNIGLVNETLSGMAREEGFKQVAWGNLELWYMHDHVNHRQCIKARTVLNEPVVHTTCLAREVDLVTSWNPAVTDARELASYSPSEVLMYMLCWTPWPLPGPEIVNYGMGVDLLDTQAQCVLIATKGQTEIPDGVTVPTNQRAVRLMMDAGGFKFVPLPADPAHPNVPRMEATVLVSIDAKRFVVPDAVITFILKVFAPLVYKSVVQVLAKLFHPLAHKRAQAAHGNEHGALLARLHSRPEYAAIGDHVKQWLEQRQQQKN